jgi:protein involved in polysaccharide export with SLBB domain
MNKTCVLFLLCGIILLGQKVFAQFENLSPEAIKTQVEEMGINYDDYLKLQQNQKKQQNGNENKTNENVTPPVQVQQQVQPPANYYVTAFTGRGAAATLPAFGYNIFSYAPTTFEPSENIPVPTNYVVGPGDEIIITLWGETQLEHNLTVSKEGDIYIPNVGLVDVNGLTLSALRSKLFGVLSKTYASLNVSMAGGAKTSLDVTTGKLRSVKVYVLGEVTKPGGYTLTALSTSFTALYYCGGPTVNGSLRDIKIMRRGKIISDIDLYDYLINGDKSKDARLEDEDIIFVPPAGKRVAMIGNVFRPAIYELKKGESLRDLIKSAGGLTFNAYYDKVHIERIIPFEQRKQYINNILNLDLSFNSVNELLNSSYSLEDGDIVNILGVNTLPENRVTITGNVKKPGVYQLSSGGMTVRDLIMEADSVFPDAFLQKAVLIRTLPTERKEVISFDLKKALNGDNLNNIRLENRDEVQIFKDEMFFPSKSVEISGAIKNPGIFTRFEDMTLSDLIILSGGLTDSATTEQIEITRMDTSSETVFAQKYTYSLPKEYWTISKTNDFKLKDYDRVLVKMDPRKTFNQTVTISGEVEYPGTYTILYDGEKIYDFIKRAGGFKQSAYHEGMFIKRKNALFDAYLFAQSKITYDSLKFVREFFKEYSNRIPIEWEEIEKDTASIYNLELRPGDSLNVPKDPKVIYVLGEIGLASTVPYKEGAGLSYYIKQSGGYLETSSIGDEIIILPNGKKWDQSGWFFLPNPEILAGSLIVVPATLPTQSNFWPSIKEMFAIASSTAVIIISVISLTRK